MSAFKRILAATLIAALCLAFAAVQAEEAAAPSDSDIESLIIEGSFVIRIPVENGDLGWYADEMAQDDSVVILGYADVLEDTFVARYDPVGDGDVSVGVYHFYTGFACDRAITWDLRVADGAVQEVIGGSYAVSPSEEEQDPYLSGEWVDSEVRATRLSIEKAEAKGWHVVVISPEGPDPFVFKTTIYYDCARNAFIYDKGKFWAMPEGYDGSESLGEAMIYGSTGSFEFTDSDQGLSLTWRDDRDPDWVNVFIPADAAE